jgi:hypothetical protein
VFFNCTFGGRLKSLKEKIHFRIKQRVELGEPTKSLHFKLLENNLELQESHSKNSQQIINALPLTPTLLMYIGNHIFSAQAGKYFWLVLKELGTLWHLKVKSILVQELHIVHIFYFRI